MKASPEYDTWYRLHVENAMGDDFDFAGDYDTPGDAEEAFRRLPAQVVKGSEYRGRRFMILTIRGSAA